MPSVAVVAACVPLTWLLAVAGLLSAMLVLVPTPVPDSATVAGLLFALLVTVSVPVRAPDAVGVNFTVTVHDAPTAIDEQVLVWLKSPLALTPETVAVEVPELVRVTFWVAEEAPTTVPANDSEPGLALRTGPGATPVPDSGTVLVTPAAVTDRLPVRVPAAVGWNVTLTVQDAPAAMLLPQVLLCVKSPDTAMVPTAADAEPPLVTVTVCAALVPPVATDPKPSAFGLTLMLEPLSGRYGGNVGVGIVQAVEPKMPELPPPSVRLNPTPQL